MEVATVMQDVIGRPGGAATPEVILECVIESMDHLALGYDPRVNDIVLPVDSVGTIPDIVGVPNDIAQAVIACFRFAHESGFDLGGAIVEQLRHDEQKRG